MKKIDINKVSENFARIIPIFAQKVLDPFDQDIKSMLSPLVMHTLFAISRNEFITMTELAKELKILKPQLTPIVDKLIKLNYAIRENDPNDRRVVRVKITPIGDDFVKVTHEKAIISTKRKLENLSVKDLLDLEDALGKFYKIIDKL